MFGLGSQELIIILVIALFIFGAKKLPEIGKGLGKSIREFKSSVSGEDDSEDPNKTKEINKDSKGSTPKS
jgi:TatA/E family protein of Tat protein translocase